MVGHNSTCALPPSPRSYRVPEVAYAGPSSLFFSLPPALLHFLCLVVKADPTAKLVYNDNKVEGAGLPGRRSAKADAMYEMLKGELPAPQRSGLRAPSKRRGGASVRGPRNHSGGLLVLHGVLEAFLAGGAGMGRG